MKTASAMGERSRRRGSPAGDAAAGASGGQGLFAGSHRVLVTGGTGFVGSHLVERLVDRGYKVRVLLRRSSSLRWLEGVPVEFAYGDVRDKASLSGACVGVRSVFHFGGLTRAWRPRDFHDVNEEGTRNLAEALAQRGDPGGFFVYCSSLAAAGPSVALERDPEPVRTEADPVTPVSAYGQSKLAGEEALRDLADAHSTFRHLILRPPAVYGPRDGTVLNLFKLVKHGILPVPDVPASRLSLVYVGDLVDAAVRGAEFGARGTYYVTDGEMHTWLGVGRRLAEFMDVQVREFRIRKFPAKVAAAGSELWGLVTRNRGVFDRAKVDDIWQPHWTCSPEKARRDWGYEARFTLERGLEETLSWYRANQWL